MAKRTYEHQAKAHSEVILIAKLDVHGEVAYNALQHVTMPSRGEA